VQTLFPGYWYRYCPSEGHFGFLVGLPTRQQPKSVTVVWGGRRAQDLYFDVAAIPVALNYVPVLSRPPVNWSGATGYVRDCCWPPNPICALPWYTLVAQTP